MSSVLWQGDELGKTHEAAAPDCAAQGLLCEKSSQSLLAESSPLALFWTLWSDIQAGWRGCDVESDRGHDRLISKSLGFSCEVKTAGRDGAFSAHSLSSGEP